MPTGQRGGGLFNSGYGVEPAYAMTNGMNSGVLQYLYYFITLLILLLVILVLVHFTITPIFKTRPGSKGVIPLPGSDDSKLYWKTPESVKDIQQTETPLGSTVENWSLLLDIQVDNPTANTGKPRILFLRGPKTFPYQGTYSDADTIMTVANSFNVIAYLDKLTNDLNISVQTRLPGAQQSTVETIVVPNIPVRKAIRLGVMVGTKVLEVYVNGWLVRSKAHPAPLAAIEGPLQPPFAEILATTARVRNLRVFPRPLSPAEFRAYGSATDFDLKDIPDSCAA